MAARLETHNSLSPAKWGQLKRAIHQTSTLTTG